MAICDAKYRFIYANIGNYGQDNDASIFSQTEVHKCMENNSLNTPQPELLDEKTTPYFFVGDDIFALKPWLLKPYSGKCDTQQEIFNYRLSRARRTIENSFGIMAARWRILRKPIRADVKTVDWIVKACVALHNYLLTTDNARYHPSGFVDSDNADGIMEGDWRNITREDRTPALQPPTRLATRNFSFEAKMVREHLKDYVNGEGADRCPWQLAHVTNTGKKQ